MATAVRERAHIGGIILAGGGSRRMGTPKESLRLTSRAEPVPDAPARIQRDIHKHDDTFMAHIAAAMQHAVDEIIISIRPGSQIEPPRLEVPVRFVFDDVSDAGPLAGLAASLEALRPTARIVLTCPCDTPLVPPAVFHLLADRSESHRAVICQASGRRTPLLGAYRTEDAPVARELLQSGERRARALAEAVGAFVLPEADLRRVDPELHALRNINTPQDYAQLKRETGTEID